jgi:hypothetical protein
MREQASTTGQPAAPGRPCAPQGLEGGQGVTIEKAYEFVKGRGRRLEHDLGLMFEGRFEEQIKELEFEQVVSESRCENAIWRELSLGIIKCGGEVVGVYATKYIRDEETSDSELITHAIFKEEMKITKIHRTRARTEWGEYETVEHFPAQPHEFEGACRLLEVLEIRERR